MKRISNRSKKAEAFFAGVIKEWAAEQPTEITTTAIDLEFLPTDTNEDRGVQNLELVLQQMHTAPMALASYEANDIVANSRKNPLEAWRRLQKRYDPRRQEEENETFCARSFLLDGALFWNSKRGSNAGSPACLATTVSELKKNNAGRLHICLKSKTLTSKEQKKKSSHKFRKDLKTKNQHEARRFRIGTNKPKLPLKPGQQTLPSHSSSDPTERLRRH